MDEQESQFTDDFTASVINEEPVVLKGLTDAEVKQVFVLALVTGAPLGLLLALLIGIPELTLVFLLLLPVVAVWLIAGWMQKARRGKPPGYVEQMLSIRLIRCGLRSPSWVCDSHRWGLGRTYRGKS